MVKLVEVFQSTFLCLIYLALSDVDIVEVMKYELQTFPPSLIETATVLRKPNKPELAKALQEHALNTTSMIPESSSDKNKNHQFIFDGGSFIHKIKWQTGATYNEIAKAYASFVLKRYGTKYVYGNVLRVL